MEGIEMKATDLMDFRKRHGLNLKKCAELLGVDHTQISRWERELREIPRWLEKFTACIDQTAEVTKHASSQKPKLVKPEGKPQKCEPDVVESPSTGLEAGGWKHLERAEVDAKIFQYAAQGLGDTAIAKRLMEEKILTVYGKKEWHQGTVRNRREKLQSNSTTR
jgi:hypothetical protein